MNTFNNIGLLVLRVVVGSYILFEHGWGKLMGFNQLLLTFPDPLGIGVKISLILVIFAEVFCAACVVLGLFTRFAAVPLVISMGVAIIFIHGGDPWSQKELAFLYAAPFLTLILTGPGTISLDSWVRRFY